MSLFFDVSKLKRKDRDRNMNKIVHGVGVTLDLRY